MHHEPWAMHRSVSPSISLSSFREYQFQQVKARVRQEEYHRITSSYNHFLIMRMHRWPYGPCLIEFVHMAAGCVYTTANRWRWRRIWYLRRSTKNQEPHAIHKLVLIKFVFSILPSRRKTEWIGTLIGFITTSLSRSYARKTHIYLMDRPWEIIFCIMGTASLCAC